MKNKIYIIHENDEWVEPLRKELKNINAPFEEWHLGKRNVDHLDKPPQGIFYNRMSASSHTRGHRYAPEYAAVVLNWLEKNNRRVINNSRALSLEISKSLQYKELESFGIKTPKTIYCSNKESILKSATIFHKPFITKHNRAGKGLGVKLFINKKELDSHVSSKDFEQSIDGVTLLQEYIDSKPKVIHRVEFVNSKFLYTVEVDASEGFELCPACPEDQIDETEILGNYQSVKSNCQKDFRWIPSLILLNNAGKRVHDKDKQRLILLGSIRVATCDLHVSKTENKFLKSLAKIWELEELLNDINDVIGLVERIENLKKWIPEVTFQYPPIKFS